MALDETDLELLDLPLQVLDLRAQLLELRVVHHAVPIEVLRQLHARTTNVGVSKSKCEHLLQTRTMTLAADAPVASVTMLEAVDPNEDTEKSSDPAGERRRDGKVDAERESLWNSMPHGSQSGPGGHDQSARGGHTGDRNAYLSTLGVAAAGNVCKLQLDYLPFRPCLRWG